LTKPDVDRIRHLQGTIRLFDQSALQNWKIDVFARDDGWVELSLATVRREEAGFRPWISLGEPVPWIIGRDYDSSKPREPVWTRAFFSPAEIRSATRFADSVLDGTLTPEAREKRFPHVAPSLLTRMKGIHDPYQKRFISDWYMFPPDISGSPGAAGIVIFGVSSCLGMESDASLMGRGVERTIAEYRDILRLLDSAANRSASKRLVPRPMSPDLVTADQAGCTAVPRRGLPRPAYPAAGKGRVVDVQVDAIVDTSGNIEPASARLVAAGETVYDEAALIAVKQLRFSPALLTTNTPIRQRFRVQVHFSPGDLTAFQILEIAGDAARQGAEILLVSERENVGRRADDQR